MWDFYQILEKTLTMQKEIRLQKSMEKILKDYSKNLKKIVIELNMKLELDLKLIIPLS